MVKLIEEGELARAAGLLERSPVFALPFKSLNQVMAVTPRWPKSARDTAEANGVATLEPISQGGTS